jgi:hypothetical protein
MKTTVAVRSWLLIVLSTALTPLFVAPTLAAEITAVRAARLIDGRGGPPLSRAVVLVEGCSPG